MTAETEIETHPVQTHQYRRGGGSEGGECPTVVTMRAYEVYCHLYGKQEAMVTGGCRGGFSTGELLCYLYARSFPKDEWRRRADEAMHGMKNL